MTASDERLRAVLDDYTKFLCEKRLAALSCPARPLAAKVAECENAGEACGP